MRSDPPLLAIHAGAPLTGAGDFQRYAAMNRTGLAAQGVSVACPRGRGAGFGYAPIDWPGAQCAIEMLPRHAEAIVQAVRPALGQATRALVIADEALAGVADDLLAGRFCDGIGLRATALRMALGRRAQRVVLTVRPYDAMLRAAWRRSAAERTVPPFASYAPAMAAFAGGWIEVAEALQDVLEPEALIVQTDVVGPQAMLGALVPGCDASGLTPVEPAPEITASAAATLQRHYRLGAPLAPGQRERIIAFHARQPQDAGAEPGFGMLELADLRGRYVADLAILAQMRGVEMRGEAVPQMPRRYARAGA